MIGLVGNGYVYFLKSLEWHFGLVGNGDVFFFFKVLVWACKEMQKQAVILLLYLHLDLGTAFLQALQ